MKTANGSPLPLPVQPVSRVVLTPSQAAEETYVLQQVVLGGTGVSAGDVGNLVAGKTGTTDNSTDAWFIGYTPKLTTALWMGYAKGSVPMAERSGASRASRVGRIPAQLWHTYMASVLASEPQYTEQFPTVYSAHRGHPDPTIEQHGAVDRAHDHHDHHHGAGLHNRADDGADQHHGRTYDNSDDHSGDPAVVPFDGRSRRGVSDGAVDSLQPLGRAGRAGCPGNAQFHTRCPDPTRSASPASLALGYRWQPWGAGRDKEEP